MQTITIPDFGILPLATIVCDYNGTLAEDGVLLPGVKEAINKITDIRPPAKISFSFLKDTLYQLFAIRTF